MRWGEGTRRTSEEEEEEKGEEDGEEEGKEDGGVVDGSKGRLFACLRTALAGCVLAITR